MCFNVPNRNLFKQWEFWWDKKHANLEIKYSWWWKIWIDDDKELEKFINEIEKSLWNFWVLTTKTAQIRDNNKSYKTEIKNMNDELVVNLKEVVLLTKKEISYDDFKRTSLSFLK